MIARSKAAELDGKVKAEAFRFELGIVPPHGDHVGGEGECACVDPGILCKCRIGNFWKMNIDRLKQSAINAGMILGLIAVPEFILMDLDELQMPGLGWAG